MGEFQRVQIEYKDKYHFDKLLIRFFLAKAL
jgi:hypothetical protein